MKLKQRSCTVNSCTLVIGIPFDGCVVHQPGSSTSPSSGTIVKQSGGTRPIETSDPDLFFTGDDALFLGATTYVTIDMSQLMLKDI
jgi:hypothetical protein